MQNLHKRPRFNICYETFSPTVLIALTSRQPGWGVAHNNVQKCD